MPTSSCDYLALAVIQHIDKLISNSEPPLLPPELADNKAMQEIHAKFLILREHLAGVLKGDLSQEVSARGYIAGLLKGHLANLRHLTWQVEQVAKGDFSQRVEFMGEFSKAFNNMTWQLDSTLTSLRNTEEALRKLTNSLKKEVEMRTAAVHALRQSEARFKYLADHDALTGALNRRSFLLIAESGLKTSLTRQSPCCIALMDIDFFKKINDTQGHQAGDFVLKHVVSLSASSLRQADSMGRYGGEEFIFFFSDADLEQGIRAAERIRTVIAATPAPCESGPLPVTISGGVSVVLPEWPDKRDSAFLQKIIARADTALYQAKNAGRNQVCAAPAEPPGQSEKGEA